MNEKTKIYGSHLMQYEGGYEVPAVSLGDGSVAIMGVDVDTEGYVAIGFASGKGGGVGESVAVPKGASLSDMKPDSVLRFDNPASIDVFIGKLQEIKGYLIAATDVQ